MPERQSSESTIESIRHSNVNGPAPVIVKSVTSVPPDAYSWPSAGANSTGGSICASTSPCSLSTVTCPCTSAALISSSNGPGVGSATSQASPMPSRSRSATVTSQSRSSTAQLTEAESIGLPSESLKGDLKFPGRKCLSKVPSPSASRSPSTVITGPWESTLIVRLISVTCPTLSRTRRTSSCTPSGTFSKRAKPFERPESRSVMILASLVK